MLKIDDWLSSTTEKLEKSKIATAKLDCLVLLEDILGKDRASILAHPELELSNEQISELNEQITRRAEHEPLAFIRGKTEFYGRVFKLNNNVLEPRPESETMLDLLKNLGLKSPKILDIGTGSGALAITAQLENPDAKIYGCDIDQKCLEVAEQNNKLHKTKVKFYKADLLKNAPEAFDVLLCNLPYVPNDFGINKAALHEPHIAIFGGGDGLDLYRKLFKQIDNLEQKPKFILTESLPFQHKNLAELTQSHGYKQQTKDDFIQVFTNK